MRPPPNSALLRALGDELRARRIEAQLSQEALAVAAEIDRTTIARIELAKVHSSVAVFVALAEALRLSPGTMLDGAMTRYRKELRAMSKSKQVAARTRPD
jgi:transcriptional regulator with XRE-family HTH domain